MTIPELNPALDKRSKFVQIHSKLPRSDQYRKPPFKQTLYLYKQVEEQKSESEVPLPQAVATEPQAPPRTPLTPAAIRDITKSGRSRLARTPKSLLRSKAAGSAAPSECKSLKDGHLEEWLKDRKSQNGILITQVQSHEDSDSDYDTDLETEGIINEVAF